jgi:hypothetical protein
MGYWQNGVTPINEDNMNEVLMFKGNVPNTDFNQITEPGYYYTGSTTMTNGPANYLYHYVEVIRKTGSVILQKVFVPSINTLYIREYSGNPVVWGSWKTFISDDLQTYSGTVTSSYFDISNYTRIQRCGRVVSFYLDMTCTTAVTSSWDKNWMIFPEGFRPLSYTLLTIATGNQSSSGLLDKTITIGITAEGALSGQRTFAVGDHIQFSGTFLGG